MCQTRKGVVSVPNTPGSAKWDRALTAATRDAGSLNDDSEQLIAGSVKIEGPGTPSLSDNSIMEFNYVYTVMVPGCAGWGRAT